LSAHRSLYNLDLSGTLPTSVLHMCKPFGRVACDGVPPFSCSAFGDHRRVPRAPHHQRFTCRRTLRPILLHDPFCLCTPLDHNCLPTAPPLVGPPYSPTPPSVARVAAAASRSSIWASAFRYFASRHVYVCGRCSLD
jgi:hypothetical protein